MNLMITGRGGWLFSPSLSLPRRCTTSREPATTFRSSSGTIALQNVLHSCFDVLVRFFCYSINSKSPSLTIPVILVYLWLHFSEFLLLLCNLNVQCCVLLLRSFYFLSTEINRFLQVNDTDSVLLHQIHDVICTLFDFSREDADDVVL